MFEGGLSVCTGISLNNSKFPSLTRVCPVLLIWDVRSNTGSLLRDLFLLIRILGVRVLTSCWWRLTKYLFAILQVILRLIVHLLPVLFSEFIDILSLYFWISSSSAKFLQDIFNIELAWSQRLADRVFAFVYFHLLLSACLAQIVFTHLSHFLLSFKVKVLILV